MPVAAVRSYLISRSEGQQDDLPLRMAQLHPRLGDEAEKETSRPSSESARSGEEIQGSTTRRRRDGLRILRELRR